MADPLSVIPPNPMNAPSSSSIQSNGQQWRIHSPSSLSASESDRSVQDVLPSEKSTCSIQKSTPNIPKQASSSSSRQSKEEQWRIRFQSFLSDSGTEKNVPDLLPIRKTSCLVPPNSIPACQSSSQQISNGRRWQIRPLSSPSDSGSERSVTTDLLPFEQSGSSIPKETCVSPDSTLVNGSDDECSSETSFSDRNCGSDVTSVSEFEQRVRDFSFSEMEEFKSFEIVWPPMVIIQNTRFQKDSSGKWVGISNTELYELFKESGCRNAKNAYGPMGHRGIALLRFDDTALGYLDAEGVHNQFLREGRGRVDWGYRQGPRLLHGKRILYGYLANKEDMDKFFKHTGVFFKQKQPFSMMSYRLMVLEPLKKMDEDYQLLLKLKVEVADLEKTNKSLQGTCTDFEKNLQETEQAIKDIRKMGMEEHHEAKQKMDYIDAYYGKIINQLREEIQKNENLLDKRNETLSTKCLDQCDQLEDDMVQLFSTAHSEEKEIQEKLAWVEHEVAVETNLAAREEFERERHALIDEHDRKLRELKRQHHEAEIELEKELIAERIRCANKYAEFCWQYNVPEV